MSRRLAFLTVLVMVCGPAVALIVAGFGGARVPASAPAGAADRGGAHEGSSVERPVAPRRETFQGPSGDGAEEEGADTQGQAQAWMRRLGIGSSGELTPDQLERLLRRVDRNPASFGALLRQALEKPQDDWDSFIEGLELQMLLAKARVVSRLVRQGVYFTQVGGEVPECLNREDVEEMGFLNVDGGELAVWVPIFLDEHAHIAELQGMIRNARAEASRDLVAEWNSLPVEQREAAVDRHLLALEDYRALGQALKEGTVDDASYSRRLKKADAGLLPRGLRWNPGTKLFEARR